MSRPVGQLSPVASVHAPEGSLLNGGIRVKLSCKLLYKRV